jgi:hypothetical protein
MFQKFIQAKNNLLLLGLLAALVIYRLTICFNYTPELCVGETNNIWSAMNVAHGKQMYTHPEETPFEIFQYTPVSQLPIILGAKIFNSESANYSYYVLVFGRICSLVFNLLTFYLLYRLMFTVFKVSKTLSLAAVLVGFGLLTHLAFGIRPDALSLLFIFISVYVFAVSYFKNEGKKIFVSSIFFAFSFFIKQDSFLILSGIGLFLMVEKKWKLIFQLAISFAISFVVFLLLFKSLFGPNFMLSIFGGLSQGFEIKQIVMVFERFLNFYNYLLFIAIVFTVMVLKKAGDSSISYFLVFISIVSFSIAFITSVKLGSWINYYTQFVIYSILLIFYMVNYYNKLEDKKIVESAMTYFSLVVVAIFIFQQIFHYTSPFLKYNQSKQEYASLTKEFDSFKKEAKTKNYVIFTFNKPLKLILFKNTIFPNTEYYHHTLFSFDGYSKLKKSKQLSHFIEDKTVSTSQFSTLDFYKIKRDSFKERELLLNFSIFERK